MLHVLGDLVAHGAELRTLELLENLHRTGAPYEQHVITLSGREGPLAKRFRDAGVTIHVARARSLSFPKVFRRVLREYQVGIVHSHVDILSGYMVALARWSAVPGRIAHIRSDQLSHFSTPVGKAIGWLLRRMIDRYATSIVAVAPGTLEAAWPGARVDPRCEVILSGLALDRFDQNVDVDAIRASLGVSAGSQLVVHLGRNVELKNRAKAIAVVRELRNQGDYILCFVGEVDEGMTAPEGTRFIQAGIRDDVPAILASASLTLVTSRFEGMPGAVLESLASGTPVLSSDLPGSRFLDENLAPVVIVSLQADDDEWAGAVARTATAVTDVPARANRVSQMRGTQFDAATAMDRFVDLWDRSMSSRA